jgi:FixJ family two-component response regulator
VLLDLMMPGMSGLEALTHFRQHHRTVPVIVITVNTDPEIAREARAGGAVDVLGKPLDFTALRSVVAWAMGLAPGHVTSNPSPAFASSSQKTTMTRETSWSRFYGVWALRSPWWPSPARRWAWCRRRTSS